MILKKLPQVENQLIEKNVENKYTFPKKIKKPLTAISSSFYIFYLFHHKFIVVSIFRIVNIIIFILLVVLLDFFIKEA